VFEKCFVEVCAFFSRYEIDGRTLFDCTPIPISTKNSVRYVEKIESRGKKFSVTQSNDAGQRQHGVWTYQELEYAWPGMAKRVKSGKRYHAWENSDGNYAVLSISKKIIKPDGTIHYLVELSSPLDPKNPFSW
jgi:hypothetical protein